MKVGRTLAIGVAVIVVGTVASWYWPDTRLKDRTAYWNGRVSSAVALGETCEQAEHWFDAVFPSRGNWLSNDTPGGKRTWSTQIGGNPAVFAGETIRIPGPPLCNEWMIYLEIRCVDGRVAMRDARSLGANCL